MGGWNVGIYIGVERLNVFDREGVDEVFFSGVIGLRETEVLVGTF